MSRSLLIFFCLRTFNDFLTLLFALLGADFSAFLATFRTPLLRLLPAIIVDAQICGDKSPDKICLLIQLRHFADAARRKNRIDQKRTLVLIQLGKRISIIRIVKDKA